MAKSRAGSEFDVSMSVPWVQDLPQNVFTNTAKCWWSGALWHLVKKGQLVALNKLLHWITNVIYIFNLSLKLCIGEIHYMLWTDDGPQSGESRWKFRRPGAIHRISIGNPVKLRSCLLRVKLVSPCLCLFFFTNRSITQLVCFYWCTTLEMY